MTAVLAWKTNTRPKLFWRAQRHTLEHGLAQTGTTAEDKRRTGSRQHNAEATSLEMCRFDKTYDIWIVTCSAAALQCTEWKSMAFKLDIQISAGRGLNKSSLMCVYYSRWRSFTLTLSNIPATPTHLTRCYNDERPSPSYTHTCKGNLLH